MSPYFGPSDGDKKESRWQNQGKRKPLLTKMTTSQKSRKVRKTGQSEKGSEEGAAPASIAKEVRPTATVAVKPSSASLPAQPEAAGAMPSLPARSAPAEERIGVVTHRSSLAPWKGLTRAPGKLAGRFTSGRASFG